MICRLSILRKSGATLYKFANCASSTWKFSTNDITGNFKNLSDDEWKKKLTPEAYAVCRKAGTERPFSGKHYTRYENGTYSCICCGSELFSSDYKFDSGTGWPSFKSSLENAVIEKKDESYGMKRTEVRCAKCDAHLGHVFNDGPPPSYQRYCINSVCLDFKPGDN